MELKKNDTFTVRIEDISEDGAGIGKTDGYTWFIKDTVIGDVVEAGVMKTKKTYGFARLLQVLEPSEHRIEPRCPAARACGGCQLQSMKYEEQLRFKERKVYNNLRRIGGLENLALPGEGRMAEEAGAAGPTGPGGNVEEAGAAGPGRNVEENEAFESGRKLEEVGETSRLEMEPIIGMENPWRYRNKAQFPFGRGKDGRIIYGFYAGRTHAIIEAEDCYLGIEENREILMRIRDYMEEYHVAPYEEASHTGLVRHALIRKGFRTGELMVCLVINGKKLPHSEKLVERLKQVAGMTTISYNVNVEKTNVILGREVVNLFGPGYITDYIGNVQYRISPQSFYQVNPAQTEKLYGTALEYAGLTGEETVWDLYCGIGTISLFLAQKAKKVYGVEIIPAAIEDAKQNAELNGFKNVEFFVGKAEEVLPEQYHRNRVYADVIVVDPPRKGCDKVCLDTIVEMAPKKVVYVSCDSSTLARDVKYLGENGYEVKRVRVVDQFGWGVHVET
ncbi:MAG: 23S rRNA (uracil(1939)-C(5))-methyltransferase RlmD, partial [Lachnospiraceae bacterium]|nr:23S rRNA (uracil(1939)-C(5))-methyltransferase RlmD [Lachnospiraceae bacterium]